MIRRYDQLLDPFARELGVAAEPAEYTLWVATVDGLSRTADLCFAGVIDRELAGFCLLNSLSECPL